MTPAEKNGYDFAKGATRYLGRILLIALVIAVALSMVRNLAGWGMDDTDASAWKRSGLRLYTDAATGVQYLSDGKGGMVRRESR